jgi:alkanesulfonate monooxygenase SsuD/methylene tetrahydromethanopterin reductase-like flavin-dependent oxidoreductase (luciferase family)
VDVSRRLLGGEIVTHRGRVTVVEAKLYTRTRTPIPLFGAAMTEATAALAGSWADGLLIGGHKAEGVRRLVQAFRDNGGAGKPVHVQMALSWAPTLRAAEENALDQWSSAAIGGEAAWDLRRPADFDRASRCATADVLAQGMLITDSTSQIVERICEIGEVGATAVYLHMVGRDQEAFIDEIASNGALRDQRS